MENKIRRALARGEPVTGIILFTGSPMVIETAAAAGIDFVIIDMEHSALDLERCAHLIRAADAAAITPLVRVPEVDAALVKQLLNLGAMGIVVPHANRDNCAAALRAARYLPQGERGACAIVRAAGYAPGDWDRICGAGQSRNHGDSADRRRRDARRFRDRLAAMPGLEVFFIGPTDLAIALGVPDATFDDPQLAAALDASCRRCRAASANM